MFDTYMTIVGNVLTAPEWRRTANTGSLVTNFKVASTARRLDRDSGRWVDGNSLRVRVNCWRKLAEGVASSVMVGDPVIVVGRMYTRDWTDGEGTHRTLYELEAVAVGHDLSRGRGKFARNRPTAATSAVEDPEADALVRGEATERVTDDAAPARFGDHPFDSDDDPAFLDVPVSPAPGFDPLAVLRGGGFDPLPGQEDDSEADDGDDDGDDDGEVDELAPLPDDGSAAATDGSSGRGRRGRSRTAVPA
jgi:single-strand DNA-binding protein